jgi:urea carboxylase-associated protein 2
VTKAADPSTLPADKQARIAALRARYDALRADGQASGKFAAAIAAAARVGRALPRRLVQVRESIPIGWYWFGRIERGTCVRLDNDQGTPGVACLLWNAADTSERFCATDTIKVQWTANVGRGRMLLSDMGRVLASIIEDTCERHDVLLGVGRPREENESSPLNSRNGLENLAITVAKLGLELRDLHAPITFFAPVRCRNQAFIWDDEVSLAKSYVDLHAEMDLLVAISNMPHPLAPPKFSAKPIAIALWRPEKGGLSRFCREATGEAERAFARTDAYLDALASRR